MPFQAQKQAFRKTTFFTLIVGPDSYLAKHGLVPAAHSLFKVYLKKLLSNCVLYPYQNLAGYSDTSNIIFLQTNSPHMVGELLSGDVASTPATASANAAASGAAAASCKSSAVMMAIVLSLISLFQAESGR
jgi:hypothetical protein